MDLNQKSQATPVGGKAPGLAQKVAASQKTSPATLALAQPVVAGNRLIMFVRIPKGDSIQSVGDGTSNVYERIVADDGMEYVFEEPNSVVEGWHCPNVVEASQAVTVQTKLGGTIADALATECEPIAGKK